LQSPSWKFSAAGFEFFEVCCAGLGCKGSRMKTIPLPEGLPKLARGESFYEAAVPVLKKF
jgi:hypothetical protein